MMSEKGHSMEWHLRQHGSAVVYMMLVGCKLWLVAPPTPHNLSLFQQWKLGGQGFTTFFPSQLERVSVTVAYTGQMYLLPAGWIHAAHSFTDSVMFCWNLLVLQMLPMSLALMRADWGSDHEDWRQFILDCSERDLCAFVRNLRQELMPILRHPKDETHRQCLLSILRSLYEFLFSFKDEATLNCSRPSGKRVAHTISASC
mmetsp:Transcript_36651/g.89264  ORF Transcript_36651/g.89264 Transcript_36651/m.89264 type:complete len:201 (-) Transcript_36651:378-980(-)